MTKKLLIAGGILAVILVVAVKYLASNLDSIVKKAITNVGTEMTGVSVDVDNVAIALAEGRGEIGGLVVGNPRGYSGPHAFTLGSIVLAIDAASVNKDVVVIRELTVEAPDIVYDKGTNGSNVEAIQNNIDEYSKTHPSGEDRAKDAARRTMTRRPSGSLSNPFRSATARSGSPTGTGHRLAAAEHARYRQEPGRHDRQ